MYNSYTLILCTYLNISWWIGYNPEFNKISKFIATRNSLCMETRSNVSQGVGYSHAKGITEYLYLRWVQLQITLLLFCYKLLTRYKTHIWHKRFEGTFLLKINEAMFFIVSVIMIMCRFTINAQFRLLHILFHYCEVFTNFNCSPWKGVWLLSNTCWVSIMHPFCSQLNVLQRKIFWTHTI